jgi:hypothetical protein
MTLRKRGYIGISKRKHRMELYGYIVVEEAMHPTSDRLRYNNYYVT